MKSDVSVESRIFVYNPPAFKAFVRGSRQNIAFTSGKTRMMCLPDGEHFLDICLVVWTESTDVTDRRTNGHRTRQHYRPRLLVVARGKMMYNTTSRIQKSLFLPLFCSPEDAPGAITLNIVWMEREFDAYKYSRSMYPSVFNIFPVIRTARAKKSTFSRTAAHIFVSPGDAPAIITQCVAWMESQFDACQTLFSMYLSIFNSFWVIRCLSQCASPKIAIFTTFLFPLGTPLRQSC